MANSDLRPVLTIGHSNMALDAFLQRLETLAVDMVVDLRSYPHTQLQPWFRKRSLKMSLIRRGIVYCYLGRELGARPKGPEFRGRDGTVDLRRWEASPLFREGIDWILEEARRHRLCLMGGPARPESCHRHHLVAQALLARGCPVLHVQPDGELRAAQPDLYHYQAACEAGVPGGNVGSEDEGGEGR